MPSRRCAKRVSTSCPSARRRRRASWSA
jgi:hypothetical protein